MVFNNSAASCNSGCLRRPPRIHLSPVCTRSDLTGTCHSDFLLKTSRMGPGPERGTAGTPSDGAFCGRVRCRRSAAGVRAHLARPSPAPPQAHLSPPRCTHAEAGEALLEGVLRVSETCLGRVGPSPEQEGPAAPCTAFVVWTPPSLHEGLTFWRGWLVVCRWAVVAVRSP